MTRQMAPIYHAIKPAAPMQGKRDPPIPVAGEEPLHRSRSAQFAIESDESKPPS